VTAVRKALFWTSAGALAWTHVGYPLAAAALARLRPRPIRKGAVEPDVTVVVAAHNEETVIRARVENLLALDYPEERLQVVVASDGSTDGTDEIVSEIAAREPRVHLARFPRGGKTATQDAAVREIESEVLAFSDANSLWEPDSLRALVRNFADPGVAYVCGQVRLEQPEGASRESVYWRYELWLRESESQLAGITGGNGAIYAVRRSDYLETDPRLGHDFGFPYRLAQRGRRAVYEPEALATEKAARSSEDEYGRRIRMHSQGWLHVLGGHVFKGGEPLFLFEIVSHRVLRYGSGLLHIALLGASLTLAPRGGVYRQALFAQLAALALAGAGRRRLPIPGAALAYHYVVLTAATVAGLVRSLEGVETTWEKAEGTR
jgi:cellulose synthase/poly-beta-1,6-N-acetylglucosamine synthase-like glycosyltransferase